METPQPFIQSVREAYEHLYDLVYLRRHPLTDLLIPDATTSRKDRAWQLHRLLMAAIDELDPGPKAPTFSREWRRHRLLVLRYLDGLDVETISEQLAISRRQYYREHDEAIEAIAQVLWDRCVELGVANPDHLSVSLPEQLTREELMRLEIARSSDPEERSSLIEIVSGLTAILRERLDERCVFIDLALPEELPRLATPNSLLRQLLLGILGFFVERVHDATIHLVAQEVGKITKLTIRVEPLSAARGISEETAQQPLAAFEELARIGDIHLTPLIVQGFISGFELEVPLGVPKPILIVDDNEDTIELFRRLLTSHNYHTLSTTSALEAFEMAKTMQPHAIVLDLMMPGRDGWDLLQTLRHHPMTRDIPIVVCTVLRQRELALALGAAAFLEKPFTEQDLLEALRQIAREQKADL